MPPTPPTRSSKTTREAQHRAALRFKLPQARRSQQQRRNGLINRILIPLMRNRIQVLEEQIRAFKKDREEECKVFAEELKENITFEKERDEVFEEERKVLEEKIEAIEEKFKAREKENEDMRKKIQLHSQMMSLEGRANVANLR